MSAKHIHQLLISRNIRPCLDLEKKKKPKAYRVWHLVYWTLPSISASTAHSLLSDRFDIHRRDSSNFIDHPTLVFCFSLYCLLCSRFSLCILVLFHFCQKFCTKEASHSSIDPLPLLLCLLLLRNLFSFDVLGSLVPALANFLPTQALHWRLSLVGGGLDLFSSRQLSSQSWQAAPKSLDTTEHSTRTLDRKKNIGNTGMCPRNTSFAATN